MSKKDEPMTVCIVGVAGFIGSHMLEKIIRERDWHVIGADMVPPMKIQQLLGAEKKWCASVCLELGSRTAAQRARLCAAAAAGARARRAAAARRAAGRVARARARDAARRAPRRRLARTSLCLTPARPLSAPQGAPLHLPPV